MYCMFACILIGAILLLRCLTGLTSWVSYILYFLINTFTFLYTML